MAKTMRESTPEVEQWVQTTMQFIEAASTYAEGGVYDADTDGMIRRLRVATSALQAALGTINITPPFPGMTPVAAPAAQPAAAPAAPAAQPAAAPAAAPQPAAAPAAGPTRRQSGG